MRIFRKMKILIFVLLFGMINEVMNFALEPVEGASDVMWSEYRKEEKLDMVYTGASFTLRAFNPYIIDEILGTSSFNMATPAQPIDQTYEAIKSAVEKHDLKTVVLGLNYVTLETDWPVSASVAFMRAKGKNESFIERVEDTISFMFDEDNRGECTSINFLFPWVYNHVTIDKASIIDNINQKVSGVSTTENVVTNDHMSQYVGKGFGYYKGTIDYDSVGNKNSKTTYSNQFSPKAFDVIRNIMKYCNEKQVELIVINTPRPTFDVVSFGEDYFVKYDRLKELFAEEGVAYYDFNLIKPEIFDAQEDYYIDYEHLNQKGSTAFSEAFAKFMQVKETEGDMEQYFYSPEEYLASVDYITNCYFETERKTEGIYIYANAYHGTGVDVEYQISIKDPETGAYTILQEYSPVREYLYETMQSGEWIFCVEARKVGEEASVERRYEQKVSY